MKYTLSTLLLFAFTFIHAQIKGTVKDAAGEPLAFASVYVEGTTTGTTTNLEGEYFLELKKGSYRLVFQYVGYKQKVEQVTVNDKTQRLDVILTTESIALKEVEIKANAEDPAYRIIRLAIAKRKYYQELVKSFSCDVYIKGSVKLTDAPKKILGQDVGDIDGSLDTNRQGIVYLSESVSKYYFEQPQNVKEVMISSKISGNSNGFSFNSARDMDIDFYRNYSDFGRNILSPIAEGALGYYRYKLHGSDFDAAGRNIYKIQVIPKNAEDPVFGGFIYILDELWNIQSADLFVTGVSSQIPIYDTLFVKQAFVPVASPDVWRLFSQTFGIKGGLFGFKFGGAFTAVYTGYDIAPQLGEDFFGNQIMKVEPGANDKDTAYWNATRPVPLTVEEATDYVKKDSIRTVRESKPWMDSIDQEENKFKLMSLLTGYTWNNSWKRKSFSAESPINTIQFNTVQGFNLFAGLSYSKAFDKENLRRLSLKSKISYGFSDEKLRVTGEGVYNFDPKHFSRLTLEGGTATAQFFEAEPIPRFLNTNFSLFGRKNYMKLFDKKFVRGEFQREIFNGVMMIAQAQWAKRSPLENQSNYSWSRKKGREYQPNIPVNDHLPEGALDPSRALTGGLSFRLRPNQKFLDYPDRKYIMGSKLPDLWVHWRGGVPFGNSDVNFHRISVVVQKYGIELGLGGESSLRFEAGNFFSKESLHFQDYKHFLGNETTIGNPSLYRHSFKMLPYYEFSTKGSWLQGNWEHNFRGFLTDKIPGFKKLGWTLVAGAAGVYTSEEKDYFELSLGLDNIGFGILRLLRFDVVTPFRNGQYEGLGYLIGIALPTGDISF